MTMGLNYKYLTLLALSIIFSCRATQVPEIPPDEFLYNPEGKGPEIEIKFIRGDSHNHPLMAIWVEDETGNFLQTLYVAESIGTGIFRRGDSSSGRWLPGEIRRPAALPYWSHRRGIRADDDLFVPSPRNPVPDAYTGPTPPSDFIIRARLDKGDLRILTLYFEINQPWDWNEFWTNNKFPGDEEYITSCQPALVYSTMVNLDNPNEEKSFRLIGHSHPSGKTGELFYDLSTITTARNISKRITAMVRE